MNKGFSGTPIVAENLGKAQRQLIAREAFLELFVSLPVVDRLISVWRNDVMDAIRASPDDELQWSEEFVESMFWVTSSVLRASKLFVPWLWFDLVGSITQSPRFDSDHKPAYSYSLRQVQFSPINTEPKPGEDAQSYHQRLKEDLVEQGRRDGRAPGARDRAAIRRNTSWFFRHAVEKASKKQLVEELHRTKRAEGGHESPYLPQCGCYASVGRGIRDAARHLITLAS